ncbi:MAG: SDR family oxidoreductase, partial [Gemmatimonadota bacterium]
SEYRAPAGSQIVPRRLDFEDPTTYQTAFERARKLFLVRPPALSDVKRWVLPALEMAREQGVEHVVFLSLLGAERNRVVPHRAIEDYLRQSGMAWTFLRASFFMQNLTTTHLAEIRDRSEIMVPAGDGRTSFVDVRDVGAVAARALLEEGHHQRAYDLTGSEALTYGEAADILSEALGRKVRYERPGLLLFVRHMRGLGHPWPFILVTAGIYTSARLALAGRVTDDVERLLGRPPLSFREFARDHRQLWLRSSEA